MIFNPLYLLLKRKRLAKARIQVTTYRKELTLKDILRISTAVIIAVLLLSLGACKVDLTNGEREEPSIVKPTLLGGSLPPPKIAAKSAYVVDLESGFVFYDKNSLLQLPPASTTKIATALAALEDYELDEVVVVHPSCVLRTGESIMGLYAGEKITVQNLLRGMLIASAGDAACALARHHQEGIMEFVAEMNHLAQALKLEQTYFVNPTGLDSTLQYSTARELTLLAREALKKRFFREVVRTEKANISSVDGKHWHRLRTTNELLGKMPGILGVKTGYTAKAKGIFIFYFRAERERKETDEGGRLHIEEGGKELLGTVMGSDNRFNDVKLLLNWVLASFVFP